MEHKRPARDAGEANILPKSTASVYKLQLINNVLYAHGKLTDTILTVDKRNQLCDRLEHHAKASAGAVQKRWLAFVEEQQGRTADMETAERNQQRADHHVTVESANTRLHVTDELQPIKESLSRIESALCIGGGGAPTQLAIVLPALARPSNWMPLHRLRHLLSKRSRSSCVWAIAVPSPIGPWKTQVLWSLLLRGWRI